MNNFKSTIRYHLREIALDVLSIGVRPFKGIHLLNGHLLSKDEHLDANYFEDQLKIISKQSTIVPFTEAVQLLNSRKTINHSLVAFSYDDGFAECHSHIAPVLEKFNGYACFFICPNFIDGNKEYTELFLSEKVHQKFFKQPMNWLQIEDLTKRGHTIGAHTMDHIRVSEINNIEDIHYQIGGCKSVIESHTKVDCEYFAFTYGHLGRDFDINTVAIAKEYYNNVFSAFSWEKYFCCDDLVLNRRQAEPYWKAKHINYFISKHLNY